MVAAMDTVTRAVSIAVGIAETRKGSAAGSFHASPGSPPANKFACGKLIERRNFELFLGVSVFADGRRHDRKPKEIAS
jgi:hypothetical protein